MQRKTRAAGFETLGCAQSLADPLRKARVRQGLFGKHLKPCMLGRNWKRWRHEKRWRWPCMLGQYWKHWKSWKHWRHGKLWRPCMLGEYWNIGSLGNMRDLAYLVRIEDLVKLAWLGHMGHIGDFEFTWRPWRFQQVLPLSGQPWQHEMRASWKARVAQQTLGSVQAGLRPTWNRSVFWHC